MKLNKYNLPIDIHLDESKESDEFEIKFFNLCEKYKKLNDYFSKIISEIKEYIYELIKEKLNINNYGSLSNNIINIIQDNKKNINTIKKSIINKKINEFINNFINNNPIDFQVIKFYIKLGFNSNIRNSAGNQIFSCITTYAQLIDDNEIINDQPFYFRNSGPDKYFLNKIIKLEKLNYDYVGFEPMLGYIIFSIGSEIEFHKEYFNIGNMSCLIIKNMLDEIIFILKKNIHNIEPIYKKLTPPIYNGQWSHITQIIALMSYNNLFDDNIMLNFYHSIFINSYALQNIQKLSEYLNLINKKINSDKFKKIYKTYTIDTTKSFELILLSRHFEPNSLFALLPLDIFKIISHLAFYRPTLFLKKID